MTMSYSRQNLKLMEFLSSSGHPADLEAGTRLGMTYTRVVLTRKWKIKFTATLLKAFLNDFNEVFVILGMIIFLNLDFPFLF